MAPVVLDHVWKIYRMRQKEVPAVQDVSLEIRDGEFLAFLGPSGCGKTSILRMIAGLEEVSRGIIRIGDKVANRLGPPERNVAMAFENYALYPHLTVRENISFPLHARKMARAEIDARVREIAQALHLEGILEHRPSQLPGGLQQMVSVARALVRRPNVLLLDEALSHLDSSVRDEVRTQIRKIVRRLGVTTILVTHDQHEALAMADRIMVMNFARVQQVGTPRELMHQPANTFVAGFVGQPPIQLLPCRLRQNGEEWQLVCQTADGYFPVTPAIARAISARKLEEVVAGVRPHVFRLAQPAGAPLRGTAQFFEFLGEQGHLDVRSGKELLTVVTEPGLRMSEGEAIGLSIIPESVLVFDPQSGEAIRPYAG